MNHLFHISDDDDDDDDEESDDDDDEFKRQLKSHDGSEERFQIEDTPAEKGGLPATGHEERDQAYNEGFRGLELEVDQTSGESSLSLNTWDNGEHLTPEEREIVLAMPNDAERTRAMNIRRRDQESLEQGLLDKLPPFLTKPPAPTKPAAKRKARVSKATTKEPVGDVDGRLGDNRRKSARHLKQTDVITGPDHPSILDNAHTSRAASPLTTDLRDPDKPLADPTPSEDALPDWIEEAMRYLLEMCNDVQWTALLLKWVELESQLGFLKGRVSNTLFSLLNHG